MVKNPPAISGDADSVLGSGRSPGGGNGNFQVTRSSALAQEIPWTKEPGGLQSMDRKRVGHDPANKQELTWLRVKNLIVSVMKKMIRIY